MFEDGFRQDLSQGRGRSLCFSLYYFCDIRSLFLFDLSSSPLKRRSLLGILPRFLFLFIHLATVVSCVYKQTKAKQCQILSI